MTNKSFFSVLSIVGIIFGIMYALLGLGILPVSSDVLAPWSNAVYGATFTGFFVTLLLAGRHAFQKNDATLMRALLYGIYAWLIIEAIFSLYYKVFFNFGVDVALMIALGLPLINGMRRKN